VTMCGQGRVPGRCAPVVVAPGRARELCSPRVAPPGWVRDSESMGGRAIGAGCGGPPMAATDRGRRTYPPGPMTLRYVCVLDAITAEPLPHECGVNGSRKTIAGSANKDHILTEYRSILAGPKVEQI
jgi:hypothetical protein